MLLSTLENIQKNLLTACYELHRGLDIVGHKMSSYKILQGIDWKRIKGLTKKTLIQYLIIILFSTYLDAFKLEKNWRNKLVGPFQCSSQFGKLGSKTF
jgi:hypothetical protein